MELEGVVHNGVIVPDDATAVPEGTRVAFCRRWPSRRRRSASGSVASRVIPGLPADLAAARALPPGHPEAMTAFADTFALIAWLNRRTRRMSRCPLFSTGLPAGS